MNTQIDLYEIKNTLHLTVYKDVQNTRQLFLNTDDKKQISKFFRSIKGSITSYKEILDNTIKIMLEDESTVIIYNYLELQKYPIVKKLIKKTKSRQKFKNLTRAVLITLGLFLGFHAFKKESYTKETVVNTESFEEILDFIASLEPQKENTSNLKEKTIKQKNQLRMSVNEETTKEEIKMTSYGEIIPNFNKNTDGKRELVHENYGNIIENYAYISGIDSALLECIYAQERGIHSESIDALGTIGIAQLLYNEHVNQPVLTNEAETFIATEDVITSLEGNIKTSVAHLQYLLNYYDGNTLIALQAYNYGHGAMNQVLRTTEARTGISINEMIHDPSCLVWLEDVKNYKDGGYGEPHYIEKVLSRYTESEFTAIYNAENPTVINLDQKVFEKSR